MNLAGLIYTRKTASPEDIFIHLMACNDNFKPALDQKVNIRTYSEKLFKESVSFEAWEDKILAGLVAAYFNSKDNQFAFISNVSVLKGFEKKGIASMLMTMCIDYAQQHQCKEIILEVFQENSAAIYLYKKFAFEETGKKGEWLIMKRKMNKVYHT